MIIGRSNNLRFRLQLIEGNWWIDACVRVITLNGFTAGRIFNKLIHRFFNEHVDNLFKFDVDSHLHYRKESAVLGSTRYCLLKDIKPSCNWLPHRLQQLSRRDIGDTAERGYNFAKGHYDTNS